LATVLRTELMRLRHGFLFWYSLLAPVVAAVPLYVGSATSPEAAAGQYWEVFRNVTLELWGIVVPMTAGLLAALSVRADQDAWRLMFSYAVPRRRYFAGKFAALAVLQLVSTTILAVLLGIGALLRGKLFADLHTVLGGAYLPWVAGLATLAIAVYVATRWGLGAAITVGVAGMLCGALVSDKDIWAVIPMAWPMRVILPLAGIGPNGIPLPPDSPLRDLGVLPVALGLSLALTAVALWAGGEHLRRKQI
jgi:ABC-2 type transport system permease protein